MALATDYRGCPLHQTAIFLEKKERERRKENLFNFHFASSTSPNSQAHRQNPDSRLMSSLSLSLSKASFHALLARFKPTFSTVRRFTYPVILENHRVSLSSLLQASNLSLFFCALRSLSSNANQTPPHSLTSLKRCTSGMEKSRPRSALSTRWFCAAFVASIATMILAPTVIDGATDLFDVQALQVMYISLNNPPQLTNWNASGGDPCGESWQGVTCQGSAVVSVQIPGLGLNGTMGYLLSDLWSLRTLDMSDNNIHDSIPYQLPPNLITLNLASNNLSGDLPYSVSIMVSLRYLNISHNSLSRSIEDIFANLARLSTLDLSFNNFSGDLPSSFSGLANLSTLHVQNNQLTGSLTVLAGVNLTELNVANNNFTGWIPRQFSSIHKFIYDGNSFDNSFAPPPPPPSKSHHPRRPHKAHRRHSPPDAYTLQSSHDQASKRENGNKKHGLTAGSVIGIALGSLLVVLLVMFVFVFCIRKGKRKRQTAARTSAGTLSITMDKVTTEMQAQRIAVVADLRPPPTEKLMVDRMQGKNGSVKRIKSPVTATSFTVASLQTATNSFSQENLIGEGSLGRVYKGEFPNGKIVAIKKIDNAALSLQDEDNFIEAVSIMSRLRHPNIIALVGYCAEHGQRLLVYDYVGNGSLHDMLHFADERSKMLTWNARVRVALGTARALEYMHEVCLPSVVHRNLKSANILLDEELIPHLSDCGLAALTPNTERQVSSTEMVGSFGYSAPEFVLSGIYTAKSDVYSFGVVMLELLTGWKPLDSSRVRSEQSLVRWATPQLHDIDALAKMVDPVLNGMYPVKSLSRFADIIALCVQPEPEFRPPMSEVVQALVRLMQRASVVRRHSSEESGFMHRTPDRDAAEMLY
ncbi:protein STRUBBELIG-RECEPTOR FAMILY 8-like isoform X2 [Diospyros lotus]|uniref:protein STRUBBELIG-RECEPTOR FAMILY 8-like isoform X2 n=1 Tax=Diospyros lotus TaxID=55363 RepID=UPI00225350DB|nr:protein STRUBBELIG-RECEPTOR FAMILY 8-like isoform X2 [Diospyros lotus]